MYLIGSVVLMKTVTGNRTVDRITAPWGFESVNGPVHCILYLHLPLLEDPLPCVYTVYVQSVNYFGIIITLLVKRTIQQITQYMQMKYTNLQVTQVAE